LILWDKKKSHFFLVVLWQFSSVKESTEIVGAPQF